MVAAAAAAAAAAGVVVERAAGAGTSEILRGSATGPWSGMPLRSEKPAIIGSAVVRLARDAGGGGPTTTVACVTAGYVDDVIALAPTLLGLAGGTLVATGGGKGGSLVATGLRRTGTAWVDIW